MLIKTIREKLNKAINQPELEGTSVQEQKGALFGPNVAQRAEQEISKHLTDEDFEIYATNFKTTLGNDSVKKIALLWGEQERLDDPEHLRSHAAPALLAKTETDGYRLIFLMHDDYNIYTYNSVKERLKNHGIEVITPAGIDAQMSDYECAEFTVATLSKLDPEKDFVINGEKGKSYKTLMDGGNYTTEEVLKLAEPSKYAKELGITPEEFTVTDTEGKKMSLSEYRKPYVLPVYLDGKKRNINILPHIAFIKAQGNLNEENTSLIRQNSKNDLTDFSKNQDTNETNAEWKAKNSAVSKHFDLTKKG